MRNLCIGLHKHRFIMIQIIWTSSFIEDLECQPIRIFFCWINIKWGTSVENYINIIGTQLQIICTCRFREDFLISTSQKQELSMVIFDIKNICPPLSFHCSRKIPSNFHLKLFDEIVIVQVIKNGPINLLYQYAYDISDIDINFWTNLSHQPSNS